MVDTLSRKRKATDEKECAFEVEVKTILSQLKDNAVTELSLCCIESLEEVVEIFNASKYNSSVISINCNNNPIGVEGAAAIAEALKVNSTLTSLNLCDSGIGIEGAAAIAKALKVNSSLLSLDLTRNNASQRYSFVVDATISL
jgi:Leucine Rich repeat